LFFFPPTHCQEKDKQQQVARHELGRGEEAEAADDAAGGQLVGVDDADCGKNEIKEDSDFLTLKPGYVCQVLGPANSLLVRNKMGPPYDVDSDPFDLDFDPIVPGI
jgi:hypothetical protein